MGPETHPTSDALAATVDATRATGPAAIPTKIGRFEIRSKLGAGGMGMVLLATDPSLERQVAIKVLRRADADAEAKQRLLREAQAAAKLSHDCIIVVHEVGEHDGQVYIAMEYVAGRTLRRWQSERTWRDILAMYRKAGSGLVAAHEAGLVHRDFKPDNVLIADDGRLRVTDFGLVSSTTELTSPDLDPRLTQTGSIMGTPRYMAPEQHAGEIVDARADQFAFCVALYEALYGKPPFAGDTYEQLERQVTAGAIEPIPDSPVPPTIRDAILRGLSRWREDRFASMQELLGALVEPPRRRRWIVPVVASVALVAIAIVGYTLTRSSPPSPPADPIGLAERTFAGGVSFLNTTTLAAGSRWFDEGQTAYHERAYAKAASLFETGYDVLPVPQFRYDAGAAHYMDAQTRKDPTGYRKAIEHYAAYLERDPLATGLDETLAALRQAVDDETLIDLGTPEPRGFTVVISQPPGATVYIDAQIAGVTPWSGTLAGSHEITAAKPGFRTAQHSKTLDARRMTTVNFLLTPE